MCDDLKLSNEFSNFFENLVKSFLRYELHLIKPTDLCHQLEIAITKFQNHPSILAIKYDVFIVEVVDFSRAKTRDLEGRRMRIAQIYACVLLYFLLKAAAFDVSFYLSKWR